MDDKINILIVEDEILIAENLKISLNTLGYKTAGVVDNALEALDFLLNNAIDFVILDITIKGEKSGIWLADYISKKHDVPFIFLTAHSDAKTLSEAVKTNPSGYLVKPFVKENIASTIEVSLNNYISKKTPENSNSEKKSLLKNKDYFFIKDKHSYVKVSLSNVLFLEADNNYVNIITNQKKFLLRNSLSKISKELPANFIQVHRSFFVNKNNIDKIDSMLIYINNYKIPIGNFYKQDLINSIHKLM